MNQQPSDNSTPKLIHFIMAIAAVSAITVVVNLVYYYLWEMKTELPIPNPYTSTFIIVQTTVVVAISGMIHYWYRKRMLKSSFDYLSGLVLLFSVNAVFFYVQMDVRRLPSINEIKRLFGEAGAPEELLWLSAPIAASSALFGIFLIPLLTWRKVKSKEVKAKLRAYQLIAWRLVKSYITVATIIVCMNLLYYYLYERSGGRIPERRFSMETMLQMAWILTAVSAMLYLYLRDNAKNGLTIYLMLTIVIAYSAFLASLPNPNGQPIYDETLWLTIPLASFSLLGELVGIPYFFKDLMMKGEGG
jgi:hypothetical protein